MESKTDQVYVPWSVYPLRVKPFQIKCDKFLIEEVEFTVTAYSRSLGSIGDGSLVED